MRWLAGLFLFLFLFSAGCATSQKQSKMHLPDCTPEEVIFIQNTYKDAWIEIRSGVWVRRIDLRITDEACIMQHFSPPLIGFWRSGIPPAIHRFHLWIGEFHPRPSEQNPMLGTYSYHPWAIFHGKRQQSIREKAAEFIKIFIAK